MSEVRILYRPPKSEHSEVFIGDKKANCFAFVRIRIGEPAGEGLGPREESTVLGTHKTRRGDRTFSIAH